MVWTKEAALQTNDGGEYWYLGWCEIGYVEGYEAMIPLDTSWGKASPVDSTWSEE